MIETQTLLNAVDVAYQMLEDNSDDPTFTIEDAASYAAMDAFDITNMSDEGTLIKSYILRDEVATIIMK